MVVKRLARGRRFIIWLVLALILAVLILLSILEFPSWIIGSTGDMKRKEVLDAQNAVRSTLLTGIAGSLFAVTALFTWRQIQVAQEGQITGRYEAAVRQLASTSATERIGGIYALGRIAEDSKRDEPTIVELLGAFCRDNGRPMKSGEPEYLSDRQMDIQVALDVLGRPTILSAARFDGGVLEGANFTDAYLKDSRFAWANLAGARFSRADLRRALFRRANLSGAILIESDLTGADLSNADMSGAKMTRAVLTDVQYNLATRWPAGIQPPPIHHIQ
jgi:pentapeptide repeat protein